MVVGRTTTTTTTTSLSAHQNAKTMTKMMYSKNNTENCTSSKGSSSCSSPSVVTTKNTTKTTTANELLCNTFKPLFGITKKYELVVDDYNVDVVVTRSDNHHHLSSSGCDSSALGDFMSRLLSSALLIVDSDDDDDCEEKKGDADDHSVSTTTSTPSLQEQDKELVVVHDNAKLPFQTERRKICTDRPDRQSKRETRWSSLNNGKNPCCAGLTVPSRKRTGSIDYSNLPMPSVVNVNNHHQSSTSPSKPTSVVDTAPTYPLSRRRCSA